jgi:hypothetical protein
VRSAALAACLALAGCGAAPEKSDWERAHESQLVPAETPLVYPPYPREADLIPFEAGAPREVRFFIDGRSIEVGADSVVRYTLVARSAAGAQNVTYEGIRCSTGEVRIFAVGGGHDWVPAKGGWRPIRPGGAQRWHYELQRDYFCPLRQRVATPQEAIDSLRRKPPTEYGL